MAMLAAFKGVRVGNKVALDVVGMKKKEVANLVAHKKRQKQYF